MKKVLVFALALAMMLSMAYIALAATPQQEQGAGTIEFQDGKAPEIIDPPGEEEPPVDPERPIDPEDPPVNPEKPSGPPPVNPEGPNPENWKISADKNLDFGLQTITGTDRTYSSYYHARSDATRFAGTMVLNESVQSNWVLQVEIGEFFIDDGAGNAVATMDGFELELIPYTVYTNRPDTPHTVNSVMLEADEAPQTIMTITPVSTVGANWEGFLDVLGGSVQHTGDAQAEMTWTIVIPATVTP